MIDATFIMVPRSPMDSNDSMLVLFGGIAASSIVLDVNGTVAALGNAWCIIGSSHSGFPDDNFSVTATTFDTKRYEENVTEAIWK